MKRETIHRVKEIFSKWVMVCMLMRDEPSQKREAFSDLLSRIRDQILLSDPKGKVYVQTIYCFVPGIARLPAKEERLRLQVRWSGKPVPSRSGKSNGERNACLSLLGRRVWKFGRCFRRGQNKSRPTPRAADTASPWGSGGSFGGEVALPVMVLGRHTAADTQGGDK